MFEEIRDFLEWGGGILCGDHQVWGCGFGCGGFDTRGSLLLRLPSSPFRGCCGCGLRILRPGLLPGGGHFRLLRSLRDRLRRGIRMWVGWWGRGGLDDKPSSDDVVPHFAQTLLLGRGAGPLSFRSGRLACGDALSAAIRRLLCKGCPRLLPLYTATVVRYVVSLFPEMNSKLCYFTTVVPDRFTTNSVNSMLSILNITIRSQNRL